MSEKKLEPTSGIVARIAQVIRQTFDSHALRSRPVFHASPRPTFSEFIRNASPQEKERVYLEVLEKATQRQIKRSSTKGG